MKIIFSLLLLLIPTSIFSLDRDSLNLSYGEIFAGVGSNKMGLLSDELQQNTNLSLGGAIGISIFADWLLLGLNMSVDLLESGLSSPDFDYSCPHSDWYELGTHYSGIGFSLNLETGFKIFTSKSIGFLFLGGIGFTTAYLNSTIIGKSNATGLTYDQGSGEHSLKFTTIDYSLRAAYIAQVLYFSIGYSRNRGLLAGVGFTMKK